MNDETPTLESAQAEVSRLLHEREGWEQAAQNVFARFTDATHGWFATLQTIQKALKKGMHHSRTDLEQAMHTGIARYKECTAVAEPEKAEEPRLVLTSEEEVEESKLDHLP